MSRPRKNNADYFSHDNDMRNDDKILSVRRKFWHEWYSVWNMLLEKLCKSTWFIIDVDNVSIELLSWDFVVDPEKLKEIIDYFVYIRLIFREWDRIYSQKMIDRFEWLLSKRQRDIEYRQWKQKEEIVIDVDNPQSKVKESKVKENNILYKLEDFILSWNSIENIRQNWKIVKWLPRTIKITNKLKSTWDKISKEYTEQEIKDATNKYIEKIEKTIPNANRDWTHRYTLFEFLTREKWLQNYINS